MEVQLKKQPQKYLDSVDAKTRAKLYKALDRLSRMEGDIVPLKTATATSWSITASSSDGKRGRWSSL